MCQKQRQALQYMLQFREKRAPHRQLSTLDITEATSRRQLCSLTTIFSIPINFEWWASGRAGGRLEKMDEKLFSSSNDASRLRHH